MAFSPEDKTICYEALGLYQGGEFIWFDYTTTTTGEVASVPFSQSIDFTVAKDKLDARFTSIEAAGDGREARIKELVVDWKSIATSNMRLGPGGTNSAPGARMDSQEDRDQIRLLFMMHLGIAALQDVSKIPMGGAGGRSSRVMR